MSIKTITFREYHQIANSFIKQIGFHSETTVPLDIEKMINKAGHDIIPVPDLYKTHPVKGVVIKKIDGFDIAIDAYHYMEEEFYFRFTLAEELAHILVHPHIYENVDTIEKSIEVMNDLPDDEYRNMEQQAKTVASCLLFPQYLFENYVLEFCKANTGKLMAENFYSKEDLGEYVAEKIYRKLLVSKHVIQNTILRRYPVLIIDKILDKFGLDLIK